ncbi:MAG: Cof-type HAD-IIB family hydrolase [Bacillota bacterium]|nr:Cof-type HAD-IIB family hydrolase [Bacillota bacterium]
MVEIGVRLVAIDVDFTLIGSDLKISERTRAAIRAAAEAGCVVTLASGRMFRATAPFAEDLGIDTPLITYDGALIKTARTREVISHRPVPLEHAKDVVAYAQHEGLHLNVYMDDTLYVERHDEEALSYMAHAKVGAIAVGDLAAFVKRAPTKLLIITASKEDMDRRLPEFKARFGDRLHVVRSMPRYVEFTAAEVSKGSALAILSRYLGVARSEVMALGDSENDISMLEFAGVGVAVGNAADEVKKAADYVAQGENGDGVAEAIARFVFDE